MTKAIAEFFSGALTTLDICADHAWRSVSGSDIFKMALIDVNRKAKSRIITEITEDNYIIARN